MRASQQYQICVDALKDYAQNAGFTDVLIGLSGGIDSSLTAAMSVDAFGAEHVHGLLMPGPYSTDHSVSDAQDLAERLGVETRTVSICEPFEAFEKVLRRVCGGELSGVAAENTQARCRMVCLMAISNTYGWLLVNTGNKSEAMMGYSTLYGDTAGGYAPIGGLYKADVYRVARWVNGRAEDQGLVPPIPEHVLTKAPSAELAPGQEDEKGMGIDYPTLDAMLIEHVEHGRTAEELVDAGFDADTVERILATVHGYEYKRAQEPPFPDAKFYD